MVRLRSLESDQEPGLFAELELMKLGTVEPIIDSPDDFVPDLEMRLNRGTTP